MMNINREIRGLQTIQLLCGVETNVYTDSILSGIGFDISKKNTDKYLHGTGGVEENPDEILVPLNSFQNRNILASNTLTS